MIVMIGSAAMAKHTQCRLPADMDLVGTYDETLSYIKSMHTIKSCYPVNAGKTLVVKTTDSLIFDIELVWPGSLAEELITLIADDKFSILRNGILYASLDIIYMLKMSHRHKRNSVHFDKTRKDIIFLRGLGAEIRPEHLDFFKRREAETYNYAHPKLNVQKGDFFAGDGINYVYDHDSIHEAVKTLAKPAYTYFKPADNDVWCSREMFFDVDEKVRLSAVLEEGLVLAAERSQLPFPNALTPLESFTIALMKICTSITSGWFREFSYDNYDKVMTLYEDIGTDYMVKIYRGIQNGVVKLI